MRDLAALVLRVGVGVMFTAHGLQKAFGALGGPGMERFTGMVGGLGFVPAPLWAGVAVFIELAGGVLLILGIVPRVSAGALCVLILTAMFKVHAAKGFFNTHGGVEYTFIIACVCIALVLLGAGRYSIRDRY